MFRFLPGTRTVLHISHINEIESLATLEFRCNRLHSHSWSDNVQCNQKLTQILSFDHWAHYLEKKIIHPNGTEATEATDDIELWTNWPNSMIQAMLERFWRQNCTTFALFLGGKNGFFGLLFQSENIWYMVIHILQLSVNCEFIAQDLLIHTKYHLKRFNG